MERYVKDDRGSSAQLIFFVVFAGLFIVDLLFVVFGRALVFDDRILDIFVSLREPALTALARVITFCGNTNTVIGLCVLLIILPGRVKVGVPVCLMTLLGFLAQTGIKLFVARQRPDAAMWLVSVSESDGSSFPSGHANTSMILYVALLILVGRALILQGNRFAAGLLRLLLVLLALTVGLSRLYLGVHYPTDVIGGWLLAGTLLILFFWLYDNAWPSKWRVTYYAAEWDAIPRNMEKRKGWRKPKKRGAGELLQFPKKRSAWKIKPPDSP